MPLSGGSPTQRSRIQTHQGRRSQPTAPPRSSMLPKTSRVPGDLHNPDSTRGSVAWIIPDLETRSLVKRGGNQRPFWS
ncbi:hypothetical protein DPMN_183614 [Dreissena polymorpha]|uniref:Uncharacterized protein n=1 Tax=Dreissena polymorpha TaxID=45954 RepID=A0A9D4I6H8_DREPO|nr:hypothetical protein DPMN_183614 [Dreissena polymorpha]